MVPFGLKNAGSCFQKVMDDALANHSNAKCYKNDVLIYNGTFDEHVSYIRQVFDMIVVVGLKAYLSKCVFGAQEKP